MVWAFSVTLSVQQLVDCDPASNDCAGGFYFNAFGYVIDNGGVDTEAHYPYIAQNSTCKVWVNTFFSKLSFCVFKILKNKIGTINLDIAFVFLI